MKPHEIWREQCEAARGIEDEFGVPKALDYLVGEKFLNFFEVAETDPEFRAEIPAFVAEIRTIFEPWQLAEFLQTARQTGAVRPRPLRRGRRCPRTIEDDRQDDIRRSARDLLLVERAREWLLEEDTV